MRSHITLRQHQVDINLAVKKHKAEHKDQLVVAPTGSGKSLAIVHLVEEHLKEHGGVAIVLSPIVKVNDQMIKTFRSTSDLRTEYLSATKHIFAYGDVYVGTIQSTLSEEYQRMAKGLIKGNVSLPVSYTHLTLSTIYSV